MADIKHFSYGLREVKSFVYPSSIAASPMANIACIANGAGNVITITTDGPVPHLICEITADIDHQVSSSAFSNDGKQLLTGGYQQINMWNLNESVPTVTTIEVDDDIKAVRYLPKSSLFIAAGEVGTIYLGDSKTGKIVTRIAEHSDEIYALATCADTELFASGGRDKIVRI